MTTFTRSQTVRFQHCDPAGIVFYPRYFEMINETVEEWFEERIGVAFSKIHGTLQAAVPTAAIEITFSAPSRLEDELEFKLHPTRIGGSSVQLSIVAFCAGEVRLKMNTALVYIDQRNGKPARWPDNIRAKIELDLNERGVNNA